ncbi:MAG: fluoride efflux transporter CrcB [Ignavibacteriae bacterium]|nr:fluoride efflux transporter CrcB [Ignavibacteriota bacterium]
MKYIVIALGGGIGSVLRYTLGGWVQTWSGSAAFPWGTLAVNLLGCFIIGLVSQLAEGRGGFSAETRLFLVVGLLGGFTTFSAFGNETLNLLRDGEHVYAVLNAAGNLLIGLAAVWLGRAAAFALWR